MSRFMNDVYKYILDNLQHMDLNLYSDKDKLDMAKDPWSLPMMMESVYYLDIGSPEEYDDAYRFDFSFKKFNDEKIALQYISENFSDIFPYTTSRSFTISCPETYFASRYPNKYLYEVFRFASRQELSNIIHSLGIVHINEYREDPISQDDINKLVDYIKEFKIYSPDKESLQEKLNDSLSALIYSFKEQGLSINDINKTLRASCDKQYSGSR